VWTWSNLRLRIYIILSTLVLITLLGGVIMVWYTYRMEGLFTFIVRKNLVALQQAETLQTALISQRGFVSYYFLDGDPDWLGQLGEYRRIFKERLSEARELVETEQENYALHLIESEYVQYTLSKDSVIHHYQAGEADKRAQLHRDSRDHFSRIIQLCEEYKNLHRDRLEQVSAESQTQAERLRMIAASAMLISLFLALLLAFMLIHHILGPVRRLALEADRMGQPLDSGNEVKALSRSVRGLIEEYDLAYSELEKSREHLLHAEKMALVGKLAAGMAHSIRNPLTSVKMRIFSLDRALDLSEPQKEDFEVISDEIRHIDTIVENFLEFSRPPKLKIQKVNPSEVVDLVLQLLRHRLESYDVEIRLNRTGPLPLIEADPEQLKEVLVNLVVNACESMERGGTILIKEEQAVVEPLGYVVSIGLADNGPGIPDSLQGKIFQPFFTTKEEGTGLGLSIAARIVKEHGGRLDMWSKEGEGTTFTIILPTKGVRP
jgi:signal transduction histidine kinase